MSLFATFLQPFRSHRFLLKQLVQREVKARYKQSLLGYAWVLFNPLSQLLVYSFVFSMVIRFPSGEIPYILFLFAGLLPWTLLQQSITSGTQSLVENSALMRKVAFPRETIPYAVVAAKLVDFFFSGTIFFLLYLIISRTLPWTVIGAVPLLVAQLALISGITLLLSAANLLYRDVQYLANLFLMLWFYLSPVLYPASLVPPQYWWLYRLNPMVGLLSGYRSFLFNKPLDWPSLLSALVISFLVFVGGFWAFKRAERVFADIA